MSHYKIIIRHFLENTLHTFQKNIFNLLLLQLTNKSWCRVVGWRTEDGPRPLTEAISGEALRLAATGVRDWEAPVMLRRRAAPDPILLPCRGSTVALNR